jgi:hypothetical protein
LLWGNAIGLDNDGKGFNYRIIGPEVQVGIYRLLNCIYTLFQDGEKLKRMYGARQLQPENMKVEALAAGPTTFTNRLDRFRFRVVFRSNKTNILIRTRWAIHDKNKFSALINDLKDLINQLRDITSSVADLERQRKVFANEISSTSDVSSLELLEEALKEEEPELSEVASQRIVQLTNGSLCETTDLEALASESAYVTAPSIWSYTGISGEDYHPEVEFTEGGITALSPNEVSFGQPPSKTDDIIYGYQNNLKAVQQKDREKIARARGLVRKNHFSERAVIAQLRKFSEEEGSWISLAPFDDNLVSKGSIECYVEVLTVISCQVRTSREYARSCKSSLNVSKPCHY